MPTHSREYMKLLNNNLCLEAKFGSLDCLIGSRIPLQTYCPPPMVQINKGTCYSSKTASLVSERRITCGDPSEQLKMCKKVWLSKFKQWDPGKLDLAIWFTTLRTRLFLKGLVMIEKRNYLDK